MDVLLLCGVPACHVGCLCVLACHVGVCMHVHLCHTGTYVLHRCVHCICTYATGRDAGTHAWMRVWGEM